MPTDIDSSRHIVLVGFVATGKTTVGRALATRLGRDFVDTDAAVERRAGLSIADLFKRHGEAVFREHETAVCRDLATRSGLVIATGAGAIVDQDCREALMNSGHLVCLNASLDELERRLRDDGDRPLLTDRGCRETLREPLVSLFEARSKVYSDVALQVETTGREPDEVVDAVEQLLADMS
jgi:shikimate kinase